MAPQSFTLKNIDLLIMDIKREYAFGVIPFYRESLGEYVFFIGLTQNRDGRKQFWKFPKGHKDNEEEDDVDAAIREMWEETGVRLEQDALIKSVSFKEQYFFEVGDEVVRKMNTFYLGEVDEDLRNSIKLDEKEFVEYRWLNFNDTLALLPGNSKQMLIDAHDFLVRHRV